MAPDQQVSVMEGTIGSLAIIPAIVFSASGIPQRQTIQLSILMGGNSWRCRSHESSESDPTTCGSLL